MTSFRVFLILLISLGQSAESVKFRNAMSLGTNQLLSRGAAAGRAETINGLEKLVSSLAAEAVKRKASGDDPSDANTTATVASIKALIDRMLNETQNQHDMAEAACNSSFTNVSLCSNQYTNGSSDACPSNITTLRSTHVTCREAEEDLKEQFDICNATLQNLSLVLGNATADFNEVNGTHDGPTYCAINGTETSSNDVESYLQRMADKYDADALTYLERKWAFGNATEAYNNKSLECTAINNNLTAKDTECKQDQLDLENMACEANRDVSLGCDAYYTCYNRERSLHDLQVNASTAQEEGLKQEYRAIKRINCYLDVFGKDTMNSSDIQACIDLVVDLSPMNITCAAAPSNQTLTCDTPCIKDPSNSTSNYSGTEYDNYSWTYLVDDCEATCCL
eukprot:TRINITY_DN893_c0_g1_i1.p1 TRINITY_DN893_c0_g1~~TRINITY_DN893_c0_g1_i1.p1  ORF type:complete len:395 (-),score=70.84 TRINITY_DN893_c0_g1_i1:319-1503(-)